MAPSLRLHAGKWRGASRRPPSGDFARERCAAGARVLAAAQPLPWLVDMTTLTCQAKDPVDKVRILAQIKDTLVSRFDEDVSLALVPGVQVLILHRCAMSAHLVAHGVLQKLAV